MFCMNILFTFIALLTALYIWPKVYTALIVVILHVGL